MSKPRLAESASDMWKAMSSAWRAEHCVGGKRAHAVTFVLGVGNFSERGGDIVIEEFDGGVGTYRKASKWEISCLDDAIATDTAQVILLGCWHRYGQRTLGTLHSPSGNSWK